METIICIECKGKIDSDGKPIEEILEKNDRPNIATDAVVIRQHKDDQFHDVLMINRKYEPFKDCLALPGGFVDYNEDPQEGCLRELKEECELDGESIEFLTVKSNPNRDPRKHIVSLVYLVQVNPDSIPKAGDDAKEAKFYNLKDLILNKEKLAFDHYEIVEELINKKFKDIYH